MKAFLLGLFIFFCCTLNAQQWFSKGQIISGGSIYAEDMLTDAHQNTYTSGRFSNSITSKSTSIPTKGADDIFLTKRDDALNEIWTITIGGTGTEGRTKILLTGDGILMAGTFGGELKFSDAVTLTPGSGGAMGGIIKGDVFLAKYDFDGNFQWAKHVANGFFIQGTAIAVDPADGSILTAGVSSSTPPMAVPLTFMDTNVPSVPATPAYGYFAKFSSTGTPVWYATVSNSTSAGAIAVTSEGYILGGNATGSGTVTLSDMGNTTHSFTGEGRYFHLLYLDKDGSNPRMVIGEGASAADEVTVSGIAVHGDVLCLGGTYKSNDFNFGGTPVGLPNSPTRTDVFLLRVESEGAGGYDVRKQYITVPAGTDYLRNIAVQGDILYASGDLSGAATFHRDRLNAGLFVAAYDLLPDSIAPIGAISGITGTGTGETTGLLFTPTGIKIAGHFTKTLTIEGTTFSTSNPASTSVRGAYMGKGALIAVVDSIGGQNVSGYDASAANGSLQVADRGLLPGSPHTLEWSKEGQGVLDDFRDATVVNGLDTGRYTIKLTYNEGRSYRTYTYRIMAPDAFGVEKVEVENADCVDADPVGTIRVTAHHGPGTSLRYSIAQTGGSHTAANENGIFADCPAGAYDVTVELLDAGEAVLADTTLTAQVLQTSSAPAFTFGTIQTAGYNCNRANSGLGLTGEISTAVTGAPQEWAALQNTATGAVTMRYDLADNNIAFTQVPPGTYRIVAGTGLCIQYSDEIDMSEPPAVIVSSIDAVAIDCKGNSNGSITITASGGTGELRYSLYPSVDGKPDMSNPVAEDQTVNTFGTLSAGNYIIVVRDERDCEAQKPAVVNEGYDIALSVVAAQDACAGEDNGQLTVSASGSPSGAYSFYLYPWGGAPGAAPDNTTGIYTGLAPSVAGYDVKVTDHVYGCESALSSAAVINELDPIVFSDNVNDVAVTGVKCFGDNSGAISVANITGGTGNYTVTVKQGETVVGSDDTAPYEFSGLIAGTYTISLTDDYGCTSAATRQVTITEPALLVISGISATAASCAGQSDGTVSVTAAGGTTELGKPHMFELFSGVELMREAQVSAVFTGLPAGNYVVRVTDANGCTALSGTAEVTQPAGVTYAVSKADVRCHGGSDGSIRLDNVSSPGQAKTYYLIDEDGRVVSEEQANPVFSGLSAGVYKIQIMIAGQCDQLTEAIEITEPEALAIVSATPTIATCNDDGTITVEISGGVAPCTVKANESDPVSVSGSTYTFADLAAGSYTVSVSDACVTTPLTETVVVEQTESPVITSALVTRMETCLGSDGELTVTASGITGLQYNIDGGSTYQTGHIFAGLTAGDYTVTVQDENACTASEAVTVTHAPDPAKPAVAQTRLATCDPADNGEITATMPDGSTYEFSIDGGSAYQPGNVFTGLATGTACTVTVKNEYSCTTDSDPVTVERTPDPVFTAVQTGLVRCDNETSGAVTLSAEAQENGSDVFRFSFNSSTPGSQTVYGNLPVGVYTAAVVDGNGCTASENAVNVRKAVDPVVTNTVTPSCYHQNNGTLTVVSVSDGTPVDYRLSGSYSSQGTSPEFTELPPGDDYVVTVTDSYACIGSSAVTIIAESSPISADIAVTDASSASSRDGSIAVTNIQGGTPGYTVSCNGIDITAGAGGSALFDRLWPSQPGKEYGLAVKDAVGCSYSTALEVGIATGIEDMDAMSLKIYPNPSDGRFIIEWTSKKDIKANIEIYSASGRLIYKTQVQTGTGGVRTAIDISNYANGSYILRIPELEINEKLIVH